MQNRNLPIALGIIAAGLLAFILVYKIAVQTPRVPAPEGILLAVPQF